MAAAYDTIVVGLGGMGSAATYHLAGRGKRVLGLERFTPVHSRGSSHGQSRIIRQAYFEDPAYVPLVLHAYDLWRKLEAESGRRLLSITGGLMLGSADSEVVTGSIHSAQTYGLAHEILSTEDIRKRFSPFSPAAGTLALYEKEAGIIRPEESVGAHLEQAAARGAELHFEEPVVRWEAAPSGDGVRVATDRATYAAERLVIAPGAWAPSVLTDLHLPLEVERQVQYWFEPAGGVEPFLPDRFPIYIWENRDGSTVYGFPAIDGATDGVKVAFHHMGAAATADTIDREVHPYEIARMQSYLAAHIPALDGRCLRAVTCMYTNTPDQNFVIATHPDYSQVAIAAGFSGHGYKFACVVGEILADLATDGSTRHAIALFTPGRFA